ncbi:MAG: dTDP-4-dehydrorhamnose reductase [Acidobacteriota bacterium]|nr:dTDP-4-dehydrorhamnose reductase [Acidobacteriota bacterium]
MQENLKIRPLIIGAGGLVGRTLVSRLEPRFPHTVSATRAEIDICDRWGMAAEIARLRPTVVLNCAAMSNVDACEEDPEAADRVNAEGPAHLAEICRREGIRLIHFSTDYVFDGEKQGEYDEADAPGPVNHYGWSKLRGEQAVLETLVEAVVLRVSFVFGSGRPTFLDKIADQLRQGDGAVRVFEGWASRPTCTLEIAQVVERILESDLTGVWHLANPPAGSRADFARELARVLGADPERVEGTDPAAVELPARRPSRTPLATSRLERALGWKPRDWREWAAEYLGVAAGEPGEEPR